jgi:outer membrane protein assembly factor BamB
VNLSSSSAAVQVPATVTVAAGSDSATFTVPTAGGAATTTARVTASVAGVSETGTLTIKPATLASLTLDPSHVLAGASATGTVSLNGHAPSGGLKVNLSSKLSGLTMPTSVTISGGQEQASFTVTTPKVTKPISTTITATEGSSSIQIAFSAIPLSPNSLTVSPAPVVGGSTASGTVTLNSPVPAGGFTVNLSSDQTAATVPPTVTVPAGDTSATFDVWTTPVATDTDATIIAEAGGSSVSVSLTIIAPDILTLALNPSTTYAGGSSTGSITLTGAAPVGGLTISLSSDQAAVVVPSTLFVVAGRMSATFTITTTPTSAGTTANIVATDPYDAIAVAQLTVTPPGGLAAGGWPKFRGNAANTGLGTGTGADGTLVWSVPTTNQTSWSSPAIGPDGTVYVGSDDGNIYAVSPAGVVQWTFQTGGRVMASPAVDSNGIIYAGSDDFYFYAINRTAP